MHLIAQDVQDMSRKLDDALGAKEGPRADGMPKKTRYPARAIHPRDQAKRLFPSRDFH